MKNFFKKVGAFLRKTWVWTLLLVLLAALLVWFVGPLLAVADYKFWESPTSRLLSISLMFLVWGLAMVFVSWRAGVRRKAVEDSDEGQERLRRDGLIEDEQKELRSRFKDALRTLKTSSLYRGRSERWRNELPWYLLIGPQGSGKTSLLDFSGLEFPINRIDRKLTRDTAGTRYCDWYFADHGVLIDTAGRYLTQADGEVDGGAWATLLGLLRKRRRARPLNGVMVSIPVETLLSDDEMALDTLARQVRARLQEIQQTLHLDLPVYLVLSKADQLLGFDEFFDQLSREESDQVLGTSFGKEQNGTDVTVLRQAFEDLLRRLNSQVIMRIHWGQRALYVGSLALLLLFGLLWAGGFSANHERLERVRELAQQWAQQRQALGERDDAMAALKTLDSSYAATTVFPPKGEVSLHERAGLYQGNEVNPPLAAAYRRELETQLLPRVARMLEAQIRGNMQNRERLLNSLRAYLMLNLRERRENGWLKDWVATEWSQRYAGNGTVQNGLNTHFARLLEQPFSYPLNDTLVAQARQVLRSESLANVVYRVLREQARSLPEYRFGQHLGPQAGLFVGTDYVIPGFYTQQGYQQYFVVQGASLVNDILRDNWVLGEGSGISDMDLRRLMVELEQLYFRDYANFWSEAVGRLGLLPFNDAGEGADQVSGLLAANSPILQLLLEVRENTRFPVLAESAEALAEASDKAAEKGGKLGKAAAAAAGKARDALAKNLPDTAKKSLQRRFEPLHRLLDDNNGPAADLTPLLQALNELQLQLAGLARASQPEQAAFDMAKSRMGGQRDALSNLRNASARLPRPLGGWFSVLAEDAWRLVLGDAYLYLNQRYQSELYGFYSKAINKRYPFNAHSASDVAVSDFREFFKAQGVAERFFETYMRPFVSGDPGSYRLRSVDGYSLPMSKVYLDQMGTAQVIRQSFFAENPAEPQVRFRLEPYTLDPGVSRAEFRFDGQSMEYRHGPIVPMSFKWPSDADGGRTSLVLEKMAGRPVGIERNTGPWSLFRLFDLMQTEYLSGRDVMVLKADLGGLRANYLLLAQRTPNPFDLAVLRSFRMPVQL